MPVHPTAEELPIEDAKALLALRASGRLYAIEDWVQAGRSLQVRNARLPSMRTAWGGAFRHHHQSTRCSSSG